MLYGVVTMQLPNQWLWDLVNKFVYQFQSFCQYKANMKNKTEQEITLLRQFDQVILSFGFDWFLGIMDSAFRYDKNIIMGYSILGRMKL